jgi:thiol-disulfide isomerase/thioredoxin
MKKASSNLLCLATAGLLLTTGVWAQTPATPAAAAPAAAPAKVAVPFREDFGKLKQGEVVPDFVVQTIAGQPAKFSDYAAGKITVFGLWGAANGAQPQITAQWEKLAKKYAAAGVAFLGIGGYGSREEFDQWRAKAAGGISFPLAFDPLGKYPAAAKTRQEMTPDELKAEVARSREFFAKSICQQLTGVLAPYPTTIVVDAERKLVGWFTGAQPTYNTALGNLLLRAGVKLAPEDMPERVYTRTESKTAATPAPAAPRAEKIAVGAVAPDFTTIDLAGKPVKLSDFRGKVVVLDFWATWCGPCLASMPHTNEVATRYKDQGVVVWGSCTSDTRAAFEKWVKANQEKYSGFIFSHDPAERTPASASLKLYGVTGIPQQFVIDREGKVAALVSGYLPGEVLLDAALAKAGIKVDPAILAKAVVDQQKRDALK